MSVQKKPKTAKQKKKNGTEKKTPCKTSPPGKPKNIIAMISSSQKNIGRTSKKKKKTGAVCTVREKIMKKKKKTDPTPPRPPGSFPPTRACPFFGPT